VLRKKVWTDFCEAAFTYKGDLKRHSRIRTGEKPFDYDMCGAAFSDTWVCVLHWLGHVDGENLYEAHVLPRHCHLRNPTQSYFTLIILIK
ncbi:hypothetical protein ScPMuIL_002557, partial [Solemya velum]